MMKENIKHNSARFSRTICFRLFLLFFVKTKAQSGSDKTALGSSGMREDEGRKKGFLKEDAKGVKREN